MNRRTLLAALAAGASGATAGCSYQLTGAIERRTFDVCDLDCDWADRTPEAGRDPIIVREPETRRVVVYGNMYVGSSSCDRAVLESLDLSGDTLHVVVGVGDQGILPKMGCTADMGPDQYRLVVEFRDALPRRVAAEERAAWDPEPTGTPGG